MGDFTRAQMNFIGLIAVHPCGDPLPTPNCPDWRLFLAIRLVKCVAARPLLLPPPHSCSLFPPRVQHSSFANIAALLWPRPFSCRMVDVGVQLCIPSCRPPFPSSPLQPQPLLICSLLFCPLKYTFPPPPMVPPHWYH